VQGGGREERRMVGQKDGEREEGSVSNGGWTWQFSRCGWAHDYSWKGQW